MVGIEPTTSCPFDRSPQSTPFFLVCSRPELLRIGSAERKDPQIQQFSDRIFGSRSFSLNSLGSDLLDPHFLKKSDPFADIKGDQTMFLNSEDVPK